MLQKTSYRRFGRSDLRKFEVEWQRLIFDLAQTEVIRLLQEREN